MDRKNLLKAFRCTEDDIRENRNGRMSQNQISNLRREGNRNLVYGVLTGLFLTSLAALVATRPLRPVQWLIGAMLLVVPICVGVLYRLRTGVSAREGRVARYSGVVRVVLRGRAGWHLYVGEESFALYIKPKYIENGASYHVYVAPKARRILAMEHPE